MPGHSPGAVNSCRALLLEAVHPPRREHDDRADRDPRERAAQVGARRDRIGRVGHANVTAGARCPSGPARPSPCRRRIAATRWPAPRACTAFCASAPATGANCAPRLVAYSLSAFEFAMLSTHIFSTVEPLEVAVLAVAVPVCRHPSPPPPGHRYPRGVSPAAAHDTPRPYPRQPSAETTVVERRIGGGVGVGGGGGATSGAWCCRRDRA